MEIDIEINVIDKILAVGDLIFLGRVYGNNRQVFQRKVKSYKYYNKQSRVRCYGEVVGIAAVLVKKSEGLFLCFNIPPFKVFHQKADIFL